MVWKEPEAMNRLWSVLTGPYLVFTMDPSTMVLHYGQGVFEGLKAYRTADGHIQMFRPQENLKRLNKSCRMLCIPEFDEACGRMP